MNKLSFSILFFVISFLILCACGQTESLSEDQPGEVETSSNPISSTRTLSNIEELPTTGMASDVTVIVGYSFDPGDVTQLIEAEVLQEARMIVRQAASEGVLWLDADTGITNFTDAILNDPANSYYPLAQTIIDEAHAQGIKVFFYFSATEVETPDAVNWNGPFIEDLHPEWVQVDQDGKLMAFQPGDLDLFWLDEGTADVRLNPLSEGWCEVLFQRAETLAGYGADGIFLDVPYFFTLEERWADFSPASAAAFHAATGLELPTGLDTDGITFSKWLVWRHTVWHDFFQELKARINTANPNTLLIVEEYPGANPIGAIETGLDPASLGGSVDIIAHEYDHLQDEGGAAAYGLADWQQTRDIYKWYQGMGAYNWSLCYATNPSDSQALAAITFVHQLSFWETQAPDMVDASVGAAWRAQLLEWMRQHADVFAGYSPAAEVALVYSSQTRDVTMAASMDDLIAAQHALDEANIPYVIITEENIELIRNFPTVIFPNTIYTTPEVLAAVEAHPGLVLAVDEALTMDAWGENPVLTSAERVTLEQAIAHIQSVPYFIKDGENIFVEAFKKDQTLQLRIFNANLDDDFQAVNQTVTIQFLSETDEPTVSQMDFLGEDEQTLTIEKVDGMYQVRLEIGLMAIVTIKP